MISRLERNRQTAELGTLFSLSRAFGMNVTDLLALSQVRDTTSYLATWVVLGVGVALSAW